MCASRPKLLNFARIHSALSWSYGEPTWWGRAERRRMYSRRESGLGMARNFASHSRSTLAASAPKPRRASLGGGAAAAATKKPARTEDLTAPVWAPRLAVAVADAA